MATPNLSVPASGKAKAATGNQTVSQYSTAPAAGKHKAARGDNPRVFGKKVTDAGVAPALPA